VMLVQKLDIHLHEGRSATGVQDVPEVAPGLQPHTLG